MEENHPSINQTCATNDEVPEKETIEREGKSSRVSLTNQWLGGEGTEKQSASGTSGYLFWETLDGYRMCPVDDLISGDQFQLHTDYKLQTQQKSLPMEEASKGVINYEFPQIGNFQNKLRSGAYKSKHISMDMDTGEYKEYTYEAEPGTKNKGSATKKQLDLV